MATLWDANGDFDMYRISVNIPVDVWQLQRSIPRSSLGLGKDR